MTRTSVITMALVVGLAGCAGVFSNKQEKHEGSLIVEKAEKDIPKKLVVNSSHKEVRKSQLLQSALSKAEKNGGRASLGLTGEEIKQVKKHLNKLPTSYGGEYNFGHYIRYNSTVYRVYVRQQGQ